MFKKIVSNLPFNPSLIHQIGFYADRLKQEQALRRLSMIFIALAMLIQTIAVISPPEKSLASSANHIIDGIQTKDDILRAWDASEGDVAKIYGLFGLTRADIERLPMNPNDTIFSGDGNNYWTIGRTSLTAYSDVAQKYKDSQITIQYEGEDTPKTKDDKFIYNRDLRAWDIVNKDGNYYKAFKGTIKATGETFWILVDCGNLTKIGKYVPPEPCKWNPDLPQGDPNCKKPCKWNPDIFADDPECKKPCEYNPDIPADDPDCEPTKPCKWNPDIPASDPNCKKPCEYNPNIPSDDPNCKEPCKWNPDIFADDPDCKKPVDPKIKVIKTIVDRPAFVKPGDTFTYLIQYRNTVNASLAENVEITDELDTTKFDVVSLKPEAVVVRNGVLKYEVGNLRYSTDYRNIRVTVRLKDQLSTGDRVCNASRITASNATADDSERICIDVINPCPYDDGVPSDDNPNCSEPKVVCSVVDAVVNRTTRKVTYRTVATSTNQATTTIHSYSYDFGDGSPILINRSGAFEDQAEHTYAPGEYTTTVIVKYSVQGVDTKKEADCSVPIDFEEDETLGQAKTVTNVTKDKTGREAEAVAISANDVLEYTLTTSNTQNYERTDIEVSDYIGDILDYAVLDTAYLTEKGGTYDAATKKITWSNVTIPANGEVLHVFRVKVKDPIPSTNQPSTVSTTFDCKISNEYGNEVTINVNCPLVKGVESLPNTGPGSSMLMITGITAVVGYFFFRSRLLAREIDLIRQDYVATGGM